MSLEQEVSDWRMEMEVLKSHVDRYLGTSQEAYYRSLYARKLVSGGRFPQHVWKPYSEYYDKVKG